MKAADVEFRKMTGSGSLTIRCVDDVYRPIQVRPLTRGHEVKLRNALRLIEGQWVHSVNFYGLDPEDVMLGASAAIFCESDSKNFEASNAFTVKHSLFEDDDGAADPPFIIFNTRVWNRLSERQLAVLTVHELVHFLVGDCDDEVRHDVDCHIQLCMLPPPTHVGWRHAEYGPRLRAISRRAERGGEND